MAVVVAAPRRQLPAAKTADRPRRAPARRGTTMVMAMPVAMARQAPCAPSAPPARVSGPTPACGVGLRPRRRCAWLRACMPRPCTRHRSSCTTSCGTVTSCKHDSESRWTPRRGTASGGCCRASGESIVTVPLAVPVSASSALHGHWQWPLAWRAGVLWWVFVCVTAGQRMPVGAARAPGVSWLQLYMLLIRVANAA